MRSGLVGYSLLVLLSLRSIEGLCEDAVTNVSGTVKLELSGLQNVSGNIYIAVYDSDDSWLGEDTVLARRVIIADALEGELVLVELQLAPGDYAFSIFYDRNNNGELDTNFIGIPKEPVALSNNARPGFGPPKYKDAVFTVGGEPIIQRVSIESM